MEPTRAGEVGHDLERDHRGHVALRGERADRLGDSRDLRPLGRAKQLCGSEIIRNAVRSRDRRRARHEKFHNALARVTSVRLLDLPADGMLIKAHVIIVGDLSDAQRRELERLGVAHGYATDYPTYGDPAYPSANLFFERLFTLPIHRHIGEGIVL